MISEQFKEFRKNNKISQINLGKKVGLTRQAIARIENNRVRSIKMLECLIDEMNGKILIIDKDCDFYIKQEGT